MQKIIKEVDEKRGIVQVTIADERFYFKDGKDPETHNPIMVAVPSVTWIAGHYPKGIHFYKWLAEKGWDEAEALKQAAGDKGSKVHLAISAILSGEEVRIDSKFANKSKSTEEVPVFEELSFEEVECILSFVNWKKEVEQDYVLESLAWDIVVFSEIHNYAGSVDWVMRLTPKEGGKNPLKLTGPTIFVVDFKTSQYVWTEYELQVSAYRKAIENGENPILVEAKTLDVSNMKTAILQLGYRKNKNRYKWTEIEDAFEMFLTARKIWHNENKDVSPRKVDLPIVLSPAVKVEEALAESAPKEVPEESVDAPAAAPRPRKRPLK